MNTKLTLNINDKVSCIHIPEYTGLIIEIKNNLYKVKWVSKNNKILDKCFVSDWLYKSELLKIEHDNI